MDIAMMDIAMMDIAMMDIAIAAASVEPAQAVFVAAVPQTRFQSPASINPRLRRR
jgi:hypothetical protein